MKTFNSTRIIAVDTGYGNIKTASRIFSTGITRYDAEPIFEGNILEYQGAWYRIGEGHKAMLDDKVLFTDPGSSSYGTFSMAYNLCQCTFGIRIAVDMGQPSAGNLSGVSAQTSAG